MSLTFSVTLYSHHIFIPVNPQSTKIWRRLEIFRGVASRLDLRLQWGGGGGGGGLGSLVEFRPFKILHPLKIYLTSITMSKFSDLEQLK